MIIFKRKAYNQLLQWKQEDNGSTALLLQGARRIGKSTLVEEFAKREYAAYLLIDFNRASKEVKALFDDLMDLDLLFLQLQTLYGVELKTGDSLIIFDEVQRCPAARQAIKYLVQDGRYHYLETGSLINIKQNTKNITIPSEERRLDMYPMDYEEFNWALGDTVNTSFLRQYFEKRHPLGDAVHRKKETNLRLYMLVGGMPQAVSAYLEHQNLSKVDAVKRNIIQLYYDDFVKIDPSGKLGKLFMEIPSQLSKGAMRYYVRSVVGAMDADRQREMLINLEDSKTVLVSYHANDPQVGMSLTQDTSRYKLFLCDTGLFITLAFWDKSFTEDGVYGKLLADKLEANLGYIYENLVAQMLTAAGHKLFYYTFPKDDKHYYEIGFLLRQGNKIAPLEVKSSGYKSHTSLDRFQAKYTSRIQNAYLVYTKDFKQDENLMQIPFYMVPFL